MNHHNLLLLFGTIFAVGLISLASIVVWCCLLAVDRKRRQLESVAEEIEKRKGSEHLRQCGYSRILK